MATVARVSVTPVKGAALAHPDAVELTATGAVGDAVLRLDRPMPRCAVTQLDLATGERDIDTLAALRDWRGARDEVTLGMWAEVARPGRVAVGDRVVPLP